MPRIIPDPRYFSMPSSEVGSEVLRNLALNCWPWVRSLTHSPDAVTHSPAEITAAWPTTVISSRWLRALIRRTQKPFSSLWNVTRSTKPASTSRMDGTGSGCMMFCHTSTSGSPRGGYPYETGASLGLRITGYELTDYGVNVIKSMLPNKQEARAGCRVIAASGHKWRDCRPRRLRGRAVSALGVGVTPKRGRKYHDPGAAKEEAKEPARRALISL